MLKFIFFNFVNIFNIISILGCLRFLSSDSSGKLDVLRHNGDSFGVNGAEVGVLEQSDQVGFRSLLEGQDGLRLESEVRFVVSGDFSHESLEGQLSDEELSGLLKFSDFSQGHSSGAVPVGFLDATTDGGAFSGSLVAKLLSGSLSSGLLSRSLFSSCHL